jgi:XTP/dITP diphosphohydrolase
MSMSQASVHHLLAGTRNAGKIAEIRMMLRDLPIKLANLIDFPKLPTPDETGLTYQDNAQIKALAYAAWTRMPTLADDSGLEVDGLDRRPGVLTARFGGDHASDVDRIQKLLGELENKSNQARAARFVCCLTLAGWVMNQDTQVAKPVVLGVTRGEIEGVIAAEPRGTNGFGYDPIFVPNGYSQTMAELPTSTKNMISHRAKALVAMKKVIEHWIRQT